MKRTPIRALRDFFKKATPETKAKRADVGGRAKKAGISTFEQNKIDRAKANRDKKRDAKLAKAKAAESIAGENLGNTNRETKANEPVTLDLSPNSKEVNIPNANMSFSSYTDEGIILKDKNVIGKTKLAALGTSARKKQYDELGYRYDDTIKGFNRDGTPKTNNKTKKKVVVETIAPEPVQVEDENNSFNFSNSNNYSSPTTKKRGFKMKRKWKKQDLKWKAWLLKLTNHQWENLA